MLLQFLKAQTNDVVLHDTNYAFCHLIVGHCTVGVCWLDLGICFCSAEKVLPMLSFQ